MLMSLYCVRDRLSGAWSTPFATNNDATAVREFWLLLRPESTHLFSKSPKDYSLYVV